MCVHMCVHVYVHVHIYPHTSASLAVLSTITQLSDLSTSTHSGADCRAQSVA